MNPALIDSITSYLQNNARPVDIALYTFYFQNGNAQQVLDELQKYQNADGGFGNALEPDVRMSQSTAIATWAAFRIMDEVKIDPDSTILQHGLHYLISTYDKRRDGWAIVGPEVDDYPHAPWWGYKAAMAGFGWGNPGAELLGYLIKYGDDKAGDMIKKLKQKALSRVTEVNPTDFHEVFTFKALYELADESLRRQLKTPLEKLIVQSVSTNPDEWKDYTAPPLKFISSPTDPFAHLFDQPLISKNLEHLQNTLIDGNHWEPNWDWSGTYPSDWQTAKKEWSGQLTLRNLLILRNFRVTGIS